MSGDTYYGQLARNYDAARCHTKRWALEQAAIKDLVTSGPVLDCPVGTGRFVGIYRAKGLACTGVDISADMLAEARRNYPGLDAGKGSIFALPFGDDTFATSVCNRMLDWLSPADMARAVIELRRVAPCLVVSIRHGTPSRRSSGTYAHDLAQFMGALDGMTVDARCVTEVNHDGIDEIFRLRDVNR